MLSKVLIELRQARKRAYSEVMRLDGAIAALTRLVSRDGARRPRGVGARKPRRGLSAAARRRISQAQKARWAKLKALRAKKAA